MASSDFVPISWNGEPITTDKLNQMCSNTQYLFNRSPRVRYSASGLTRDSGLKIISGKTAYVSSTKNYEYIYVYFGSFFTAGSHPVVTANIEVTSASMHRSKVTIGGLTAEIDNVGFRAIISNDSYTTLSTGGWIHWTAVGY